jgi:chromate transporter
MSKVKLLFNLFLSMLKIGLFTFGGGYAMIHILDSEFVVKKKWLDSEEFLDLVAIAESTPGPIAINCATFIGYKKAGFWGSLFSTVGMCIPSLTVIYLISLFFNRFLSIAWVASAFRGIQVCVVFLILSAGFKMLKKSKKTLFNLLVMGVTFTSCVVLSLCSVSFSSIFYVLIFGCVGLLLYAIGYIRDRGKKQ